MRSYWLFILLAATSCNSSLTDFLNDKEPDPWKKRRKITINNSAQAENLVNFPLLVRIDSTRIDYGNTQDAGQDIQFRDSDGVTVLPHEIEKWNEAGSSYIWVKVPQIDASSANDHIWMYYSNPAANDGQSVTAVWDSSFRGVWHLASTVNDSTANAFHGTNNGTAIGSGILGDARTFNGTSNWINLGSNRAFLNNAAATTMSAWINVPATISTLQGVLSVSINNGGVPTVASRASLRLTGTNQVDFAGRALDADTTSGQTTTGSPIASISTWYCIAAVANYTAKTVVFYVNGNAVADNNTSLAALWNAAVTDNSNSASISIGAEDDGSAAYFSGVMDEVRIANVDRSAAWAAADYKSMSDTFVSFGPEEASPRVP